MGYQTQRGLNDRRSEEEQQRRMREFSIQQAEEQRAQQGQMRSLAQSAFGPNPNMVAGDDEGNPMPQAPGGGGMPEFAKGMMGIDPMMAMQMMPKPRSPMVLSEGARAFDEGGREIAANPRAERMPDWKDPAYQKFMMDKARAGQPNVTTNVMPPREVFKDSMALKKDFDAQPEVKGFKEVQGAWDQISTALADPSAANDLAAATKFMKLLDPGSVVRESELVMAMEASGKMDQFLNYANRIKTGQKLTPTQRKEFRSAGEALYNASKNRFGEAVEQYDGIAKQYGLDGRFLPKMEKRGDPLTLTIQGQEVRFPSEAALKAFKKQAGM
jgi:hypothetical protein